MKKKSGFLFGFTALCVIATSTPGMDDLAERAHKLHFSSIVFDTHVDTTPKLQTAWKFTEEHVTGSVDLPRMRKGGLNAVFLSIYMAGTVTGAKAVNDSIERIAAVRELVERNPGTLALCTNAAEIHAAHGSGRTAILMGMEGGHMINDSLPVLRAYAALGVRYLTLTHSVNTDWADSSGDERRHNGLTDFGESVIVELNRQGVLVDISHVSDKTFWDALAISKAPLIASHSSCRALCAHPRNMTDDMIKALAAKGGVIQINFHIEFLDERAASYFKKAEPLIKSQIEKQGSKPDFETARLEVARKIGPAPTISWQRIVDHIDHAVKLVGADHVGLGSDYDGAVMPDGMNDATGLPKITEALMRKGYSESDVRKILGENTLRLLGEAEGIAKLSR